MENGETMRISYETLQETISDAELVLVGIGEEFEEDFAPIREVLQDKELWQKEQMKKQYLEKRQNERQVKAYNNLAKLLENKNYFIVTICKDGYIKESSLQQDRIVAPCGGYDLLQCNAGCSEELVESAVYQEAFAKAMEKNASDSRPRCQKCGAYLTYNNICADKYVESGYLAQWDKYTKWLQGTMNRKLCILELGAGLVFPNIIRWPFEKVGFYNNKAKYIRIHSSMSELTKEIREKGYSCDENAVEFLLH